MKLLYNIRQQTLISFDELMKLQPESKLVYILDSIDFSIVINSLESKSNKGPTGYNLESILRAFLVQQIENIPKRAALIR